ncbi:MAG: hypothetical protein KA369_11665 [Spirochaetes bacterium]|nr:hypothetical protein [Spirochaetota bacterium]
MIKTQIIKENKKPKVVILDYKEYLRLKEKADDYDDYISAVKAVKTTKKLHSLDDVEKKLGL